MPPQCQFNRQLDVIGVAETGSGKTAAFAIPMLAYILRQPPMTEANEVINGF